MADIPPTPLFPSRSRSTAGWSLDDESLLMDQQPIFGDESILNMTFEMGSDDGNGDEDGGDMSVGTVIPVAKAEKDVQEDGSHDEDDMECEIARDASVHLDQMDIPIFDSSLDNDLALDLQHDLDPFDCPPSPFLNSAIYYAKLNEADIRSPIPVSRSAVLHEKPTPSSVSDRTLMCGHSDGTESHTSVPSEGDLLEEPIFAARGEKATWAEEERPISGLRGSISTSVVTSGSSSARAGASTCGEGTGSPVVSGNASRSGRGKRQASSPRQSRETKKSKPLPQPRSPSRDDLYARRLSRSTSSTSSDTHATSSCRLHETVRTSYGRNTRAGPSRPSSSLSLANTKSRESEGAETSAAIHPSSRVDDSPPIHLRAEIPNQEVERDSVPPTPVPRPRPTMLSRLIAKSTVLHPPPPAFDAPPIPILPSLSQTYSTNRSIRISPTSGPDPEQESIPTDIMPDVGPSIPSCSRTRDSIALDRPDVNDEIEVPRQARTSRTPDLGSLSWANDMAPDLHDITSGDIFDDTSINQQNDISQSDIADTDTSIISSTNNWLRRSISRSRQEADTANETNTSITSSAVPLPPLSLSSSTTSNSEVGRSIRRSTSQRVIGFFSNILRSSTSSRSIGDLGKSTSRKSIEDLGKSTPGGSMTAGGSKLGEEILDEASAEGLGEEADGESRDQVGESSTSSYRSQSSNSSYPLPTYQQHPRPGLPPLPRYIPLTRPTKAFISHTALRIDNPIRHPHPQSKFTSAALSRLPPPGKGSSASGQKVVVKPLERAPDLKARRALFEKSTNQVVRPSADQAKVLDKRTDVRAAVLEKKRLREVEEVRNREKEDREYREMRRGTVVRARPVPEMYRRKA